MVEEAKDTKASTLGFNRFAIKKKKLKRSLFISESLRDPYI